MAPIIPQDVEQQYEGRWLAWDTDAGQVIASGDTMKQAMDHAKSHAAQTGHLIWYHHVVRKNTVLVGGLG